MESRKQYPEYTPYEIGSEECYELYKEKIEDLLEKKESKGKKYKYPLDKEISSDTLNGDISRSKLDFIDPCKFVDLAYPKAHIRQCSLPFILDAYEYGIPKLQPLKFRVDENEQCHIFDHEGRHRAQAACDLGIEEVPINLRYRDYTLVDENNNLDTETLKEIKEKGYNPKHGSFDTNVLLEYKDKLKAPHFCYINNLTPEWYDLDKEGRKHPNERAIKIRKKKEELRNKYSIKETVNKYRARRKNEGGSTIKLKGDIS